MSTRAILQTGQLPFLPHHLRINAVQRVSWNNSTARAWISIMACPRRGGGVVHQCSLSWRMSILVLVPFCVRMVTGQAAFMLAKGQMHPIYKGFIAFQNTVTNVSSRLVPEFGVFTCTSPGTYYFNVGAATQKDHPFRIALKLNQSTVATMYGSPNDYQQVAQTAVIQLDDGDFVYPFVEVGDIFESAIEDRVYTVFSGFQVNIVAPDPGLRTTTSGTVSPTGSMPTTSAGGASPAATTMAGGGATTGTTTRTAATTGRTAAPGTTTAAGTTTARTTAAGTTARTTARTTQRQRDLEEEELNYEDMLAVPDEGGDDDEALKDLIQQTVGNQSMESEGDARI